jgi:hypothetical protein
MSEPLDEFFVPEHIQRPHRGRLVIPFDRLSAHDRQALIDMTGGDSQPLVDFTIKGVMLAQPPHAEAPFDRPTEITLEFRAADVEITRSS